MAGLYLVLPQPTLWHGLRRIAPSTSTTNGRPLFRSGEPARRIYLVEAGRVRLHISTTNSHQPFEIAPAGSVLGLSECIAGEDYKFTAEPERGARISWVDREALLAYLRTNQEICLEVVHFLSESLHNLYDHLRQINDAMPPKKHASAIH